MLLALIEQHQRNAHDGEQDETHAQGEPAAPKTSGGSSWDTHAVRSYALSALEISLNGERRRTVLVEKLEHSTAAARNARERIVRDDHGQARFFREELVDVRQQRAAAREHDAALCDVRTELRRRLLERELHRTDDALQRFLQRFQDLVAVQRETAWHAFRE